VKEHWLAQGIVSAETLRDFLPDATELARQGEAVHHSLPTQQLHAMRTAFHFARRLDVKFDGVASALQSAEKVHLLEALARAMDHSGNDLLRECVIVLGEGRGVDALGRVWLHYKVGEVSWAEALAKVDMALVWDRKAARVRIREAELAAAQAFGLRSIFTTSRLALSHVYQAFLQVVNLR
jgi:hypothetical protein